MMGIAALAIRQKECLSTLNDLNQKENIMKWGLMTY